MARRGASPLREADTKALVRFRTDMAHHRLAIKRAAGRLLESGAALTHST